MARPALKPELVAKIKERRRAGLSRDSIAKELGVATGSVSHALNGRKPPKGTKPLPSKPLPSKPLPSKPSPSKPSPSKPSPSKPSPSKPEPLAVTLPEDEGEDLTDTLRRYLARSDAAASAAYLVGDAAAGAQHEKRALACLQLLSKVAPPASTESAGTYVQHADMIEHGRRALAKLEALADRLEGGE